MTASNRWAEVEHALDMLLTMSPPQQQTALAQMRSVDPYIAAEVSSLLTFRTGANSPFDLAAANGVLSAPLGPGQQMELCEGDIVGEYRILRILGHGGMGEVYLAERADGLFRQLVALKILRRVAADQIARFDAERQILAHMDHPGIARLISGGRTESGYSYIVMEYIEGKQIVEWCSDNKPSLIHVLQLFVSVCDSVAFAHRNLIIHRDIKPSNVFVTQTKTTKLLDFGAAKQLDVRLSQQTLHGPFTPTYAAPEQLAGGPITTMTDVHGLGLLLFELLTGQRAWTTDELSLAASVDVVLDSKRPIASKVAARAAQPPYPPSSLRGDLDAIIGKAIRKEPEDRYSSVESLRDDVSRFLSSRPVRARSGSFRYVFGRTIRRHRVLVGAASLLALALTTGIVSTIWQAHRATAEAQKEAAVKEFLLQIFDMPKTGVNGGGIPTTPLALLAAAEKRVSDDTAQSRQIRSEIFDALAQIYEELGESAHVLSIQRDQLADQNIADHNRPSEKRAEIKTNIAESLLSLYQYPEARTMLQSALDDLQALDVHRGPAMANVLSRLAWAESVSDPVSMTHDIVHSQEALRIAGENSHDHSVLMKLMIDASVWKRHHDYAHALADYERVERFCEGHLDQDCRGASQSASSLVADMLVRTQQYAKAAPRMEEAVLNESASAQPGLMNALPDVRIHLARLLLARGDAARARNELELVKMSLEATSDLSIRRHQYQIHELITEGELAEVQGLWDNARDDYLRAANWPEAEESKDYASHARAYEHLSRVELKMGLASDAKSHLAEAERRAALWQDPQSEVVLLNRVTRGELEARSGNLADARRDLLGVMADTAPDTTFLPPAYLAAATALSSLELRRHDVKAAVDVAHRLRSRITQLDDQPYRRFAIAQADFGLGCALLSDRQFDGAASAFQRVIEAYDGIAVPLSPVIGVARLGLSRAKHRVSGDIRTTRQTASDAAIRARYRDFASQCLPP